MTGAVMPPEADTIVMQEHAQAADGMVTIGSGHRLHQNLRRAGEDLAIGQVALKRGLPLRPAEIGLIASLGIGEVTVFRKLRVAFFSTGDELVSIGAMPGEGQIFDSNRYTIHGMLTRLNCEVIDMGVVRDDPALIEAAFAAAAANADVVIDFTIPKATVALCALTAGKAHVIGTTGLSAEDEAKIKDASKNAVIVKSGNMSLGVNLLAGLVQKVAATLGVNEVSFPRDDTERCVVVPADRLRCRVQHERHPDPGVCQPYDQRVGDRRKQLREQCRRSHRGDHGCQ